VAGETAALERIQVLRKGGLGFDRIAARLNEGAFRPGPGGRGTGLSFVVDRILTGQKIA
jgi:hypothetical protein